MSVSKVVNSRSLGTVTAALAWYGSTVVVFCDAAQSPSNGRTHLGYLLR